MISRQRRNVRAKLGLLVAVTAICSTSVRAQELAQVPATYFYVGHCREEINGTVTAEAKCRIVVIISVRAVSVGWSHSRDKPTNATSGSFSGALTGTTFTVVKDRASVAASGGGTISAKEIDVTLKRLTGRPPKQNSYVFHYQGTFDSVVEPRKSARVVR